MKKMYVVGSADVLAGKVVAAFSDRRDAESALRGQADCKGLAIVEIYVAIAKR